MEKQNLTEVVSRKPEVASRQVFEALQKGGFRIPLYQRDYAWGDKEISQLMDDLWQAFARGAKAYYLGTLVVMQYVEKGETVLEVVDGQQRLTTLTLLYRWFLDDEFSKGKEWEKSPLSFENRLDSESALTLFIENKEAELTHAKLSHAKECIAEKEQKIKDNLKQQKKDWTSFQTFLKENVKLFQVTLPSHTDVAAYFEVMNNRGRQLEAHEILKAKLMSKIEKTDHDAFAERWDACNWDSERSKRKKEAEAKAKNEDANVGFRLIKDGSKFTLVSFSAEEDVKWRPRIKFPELLSIALSCYVQKEGLEKLENRVFSEQRLNDDFSTVEKALQEKEKSKEDETGKKFASEFLKVLEEVRALFDRYVIHSCVENGKIQWSLMEVDRTKNELRKTFGIDQAEDESPTLQEQIVHLQSMLEVSGTSWIRDFMVKLMKKLHVPGGRNPECGKAPEWSEEKKPELARKIRDSLLEFVGERLKNLKKELEKQKGRNDSEAKTSLLGMANYYSRPLLVLNVLDYLFWKEGCPKDKDFAFRYRNSIEHFYPREDSKCEGEKWTDEKGEKNLFLDCIGNLYLTTVSENSELSNKPPSIKVHRLRGENGEKRVSPNETPKQRRMYNLLPWTKENCDAHAKECWKVLTEFLEENESPNSSSTPVANENVSGTSDANNANNVGE